MKNTISTIDSDRMRIARTVLCRYLERYPAENQTFTCIGPECHFIAEIENFVNNIGWKNISKGEFRSQNIDCLMVTVETDHDTENYVFNFINEKSCPLILLNIRNLKKTPVYATVENFGYRLLFEVNEISYLYKPEKRQELITEDLFLGSDSIRHLLGSGWRKVGLIPPNTLASHAMVMAYDLLVPQRFDIAMKHIYARLSLLDAAKDWREYVYFQQAVRITGGGGELYEYDGTGKKGKEVFLENFNRLLTDVEPSELPPVSVDKSLIAYDGSHRIAAAIAKKRLVNCIKIDAVATNCADYEFYRTVKSGHLPCPDEVLDEAAIEYCRIKDTAAIALIFPTVLSEGNALSELARLGKIVYRKNIKVSPEMGAEILKQVYLGQPWLQSESESSGFLHKWKSCFPYSGELRVILIDQFDQSALRSGKERIRNLYKLGNHSIHITDTWDETLLAARALFNSNSLKVMNMGIKFDSVFSSQLFEYRMWIESHGLDQESFCVGGSSVLGLMGLRQCNDLDFLYIDDQSDLPERPKNIDYHNDKSEGYYPLSLQDIIADPRNHFWYMGVKFCAPGIIMGMKSSRNTPKDRLDVALLKSRIASYEKKEQIGSVFTWALRGYAYVRLYQYKLMIYIKNKLRPLLVMLRK